MAKEQNKILHGNRARVPKDKQVTPLYLTNAVTMSDTKEDETPLVDEENVRLAREFSEENKQ